MTKICAFCEKNPATQTNSHILTKSWSKSMMITNNTRKVYRLGDSKLLGRNKPTQDTSKESFIFCPVCERIEFANKIETPITNSFYKTAYEKSNYFWVIIKNKISYRNYWKVNYALFKKFIYLQLFRAHVSSLPDFSNIVLSEEQLNIIKTSLENSLNDLKTLVFTCDKIENATSNIQFTTKLDNDTYIVWINEYIFIIFFKENNHTLFKDFEVGYTFENMIRIIPIDYTSWTNFKRIWFNMIMTE